MSGRLWACPARRASLTPAGLGVDLDVNAIAEARDRAAGLAAQFEGRDATTAAN
jgi:hypothetical protein